MIAPGLSKAGKLAEGGDIENAELEDLAPAIGALFETLDDDKVDALLGEVLKHATIVMPDEAGHLKVYDLSKGDEIDFAFTGKLPLMFAVVKYALEVNFGGFFGAKGALAAIAAAAERPSPST